MNRSGPAFVEILPRSVVKRFSQPEDYFRELRVYQAGLPMVPKLLRFGEREWIELERIAGKPYLDSDFGPREASLLAAAIAGFHQAWFSEGICLCHWDNQPKNILRCKDGFRFIDFSLSRLAPPEADLSHLFLFWAAEYPPLAFEALCAAFLAAYRPILPLDPGRWETALNQSRERFAERRRRNLRREHHVNSADFAASLGFLSHCLGSGDKSP
ncbi:MAG: phosphotransferase [Candidatus Cloacimonetes bacterium]|nr:phosphotransferase [Candidatus Cloacimonadota bacterium]